MKSGAIDKESGPGLFSPLLATSKDINTSSCSSNVFSYLQIFVSTLGGLSFLVGTWVFYYPSWKPGGIVSAVLFTIGSLCFLTLDTQGVLASRRENIALRINAMFGWVGSLLCLVGTIGFFPAVYKEASSAVIKCFLVGTFIMACAQLRY
jgi:hypothetical protein